jgi:hypothetical protein
MDSDFWNDATHPLRNSPGIIFIDVPPDQPGKAIDSLVLFYALFAKYWPLDWWKGMKAKLHNDSFILKCCTFEGRIDEDEYKITNHKLVTRKIR